MPIWAEAGLWGLVAGGALVVGALVGALALDGAPPEAIAVITAVAAGAILTMIADTMIPEAFERTHLYAGLLSTVGFLTAFTIGRAG